jgi:hypothetical protein
MPAIRPRSSCLDAAARLLAGMPVSAGWPSRLQVYQHFALSSGQRRRCAERAPKARRRALALIHRGWEGDAAAALRDCEAALELDPGCMKAHYRRVQALAACKMLKV